MLGSGLGEEVADTETPREAVKSGGDLRRVIVEGATRILTRGRGHTRDPIRGPTQGAHCCTRNVFHHKHDGNLPFNQSHKPLMYSRARLRCDRRGALLFRQRKVPKGGVYCV